MTSELNAHQAHDEEARQVIREKLFDTMLVEAGAGTGKTRALVDRYVALLRAGRQVEELVAVTFTEKAAAELRDRIRGELEGSVRRANEDVPLLQRALASLDRAQISTIHAFAVNVLRPLAAEFGINPSFQVHDAVAGERRFQEHWHAFLEDAGQEPDAREVVTRVLSLGLATRDLERLAHELWGNGALADMMNTSPLVAPPAQMPDLPALQAMLVDLDLGRVRPDDRLRASIEEVQHALGELSTADVADREALLATVAAGLTVSSYGRAASWGGKGAMECARATANEVCAAVREWLISLRTVALAQLLPLIVRFVVEESRARLRDGELVFDDLILQLRNLLRDSVDARRRLRARFKTFLIDEFQDTDPLQVEIALAFARDPDTGALEPGRLFLVGDPKQSIYRFRRADMAVYAAMRTLVESAGGRLPELALNQRSRAVVLDFVNTTFATMIGSGDRPSTQPPYRPVHAVRGGELRGPDVGWIGGAVDAPVRDIRRTEARQIAAYCRGALAERWQVGDRHGIRLAGYRDIAILVPTRAILQPLERALAAASVPYRVEGGSLIYATQEVRDLINCLTAIDDPTDDIAVVAALRSPAYACSDVELAEHRLAGSGFNYLAPGLEQRDGRVPAALVDLRALYLSRQGSLARLVERLIATHRTVEAGMYDAGNRNAFRRARFVIEQARAFEAPGPESLRAFIEWLERRAREAIMDHEGAHLDDDEDAVRVLTIHGSKGLEFPIVFMAGLGVAPSNQQAVLGVDRISGAISVSAISVSIGARTRKANFVLGPVDDLAAQETAHLEAERDRLLYVAATRARDHLVLFLYHQARAHNVAAQRLIDAGVHTAAIELPELPELGNQPLAPFAGLLVESGGDESDEEFDAARATLVEEASGTVVTSATAMGRSGNGKTDGKEREDESEPWARGRSGTHRGRAVHAALQVLPWDADDATVAALARAQAVAEAIPDEADRVAELLRKALATDAAGRARAARRAHREVPFALAENGVILEGFIDLVLEGDDGGIEIVDWKTDSVPAGGVAGRLESYRLQAGLYVLGLEAAIGRIVQRVTYVFVSPDVEVSPGDPSELASLAQGRLRTYKQTSAEAVRGGSLRPEESAGPAG
jgi:ATP-dependent helicase/nuclease subunit A